MDESFDWDKFKKERVMCPYCLVGYNIEDMTVMDGVVVCEDCAEEATA